MNREGAARGDRPAPWLYLFGVLVWTWTFHGPAALTGQRLTQFPTVILAVVGALGPGVVAGLLVASGRWDPALDRTVGDFFRRAFDPRALPWRWYVWIAGQYAYEKRESFSAWECGSLTHMFVARRGATYLSNPYGQRPG
jgi:hypothetical protein